jgi:putative endonuclease
MMPFMSLFSRVFGAPTEASLGARGERAAERHLRRIGYHILERGCRSKVGEIDLVALVGDTVVLVEVKTRRSDERGTPAEAVGKVKQRRLTQAALGYLKARKLLEHRARFDVVAIMWPKGDRRPRIDHFQNAFEPTGFGQFFS